MMDGIFEACSSLSMSMLKVDTLQIGVLGHTAKEENLESSRDECRKQSKDKDIFSKYKEASNFFPKVSTIMSN